MARFESGLTQRVCLAGLGNAAWHEELRIEYKGDADGTAGRRGIR